MLSVALLVVARLVCLLQELGIFLLQTSFTDFLSMFSGFPVK